MTETKGPVNCTPQELCTFLQALEEGYLPTCSSTISQSAPSRTICIASADWVEWLMGLPIGLTDLEPLETPKFLSWLQLHSRS